MTEGWHWHSTTTIEEVVVNRSDVRAGDIAVAINVTAVVVGHFVVEQVVIQGGNVRCCNCSVTVYVAWVVVGFFHLIGNCHREQGVAASAGEGDLAGGATPVSVARIEASGRCCEALLSVETVEVNTLDGCSTGSLKREGVAASCVKCVLILIVGGAGRAAAGDECDITHGDVVLQIGWGAACGRGQTQLSECLGRAEVEDGCLGDCRCRQRKARQH